VHNVDIVCWADENGVTDGEDFTGTEEPWVLIFGRGGPEGNRGIIEGRKREGGVNRQWGNVTELIP